MVGGLFRDTVVAYEPRSRPIVFIPMHDYNKARLRPCRAPARRPDGFEEPSGRGWFRMLPSTSCYGRQLYPLALEPQLLPHGASKEDRVERVSIDERQKTLLNPHARYGQRGGGRCRSDCSRSTQICNRAAEPSSRRLGSQRYT